MFNDNKTFWQRIKRLFSDKLKTMQSDIIRHSYIILNYDYKEVAEKLNNCFSEAVENLNIESY